MFGKEMKFVGAQFSDAENYFIDLLEDQDLKNSILLIRSIVEKIWSSEIRIVRDFTDHGIEHSKRLIDLFRKILNANDGKNFSVIELYSLLAGAYLHDIGMQCDLKHYSAIEEISRKYGANYSTKFSSNASNYSIQEQNNIRNNHQYITASWIDYAYDIKNDPLSSAILSIPNDLIDDIIDICRYHSKMPITDCPINFHYRSAERKQLTAAILRFSDELDIDSKRVTNYQVINSFSMDPSNKVFWYLHSKTIIDFTSDNCIMISIRIHPSDFPKYKHTIHEKYITEFYSKIRFLQGIMAKNQIPIIIDPESGVKEDKRSAPLPQEIIELFQSFNVCVSPLEELVNDVVLVLQAIKYEIIDKKNVNERIIDINTVLCIGTIKQNVYIRCVGGEINNDDILQVTNHLTLSCPHGWVISDKRISTSVSVDDFPNVKIFNYSSFLEQMIWEPYYNYLLSITDKSNINRLYIDIGCYKLTTDEHGNIIGRDSYKIMDEYIDEWLNERGKMHISVLGEFGSGKTWFCRHYALLQLKRFKRNPTKERLPILITLRDFNKSLSVKQLINDVFLEQYKLSSIGSAYDLFQEMNRKGKLLLILDGFDEMARKVDYKTVVDNFWELAKLVDNNSKVILTCRTEYFRYAKESEKVFGGKEYGTNTIILTPPEFEVIYIEPLNEHLIEEAIVKRRGEIVGRQLSEKIMSDKNILELSKKPVLIELLLASLEEVGSNIVNNVGHVYLHATNRLLLRNIRAQKTFTTTTDKIFFLCELAWEMISAKKLKINYRDIPNKILSYFGHKINNPSHLDNWDYDLRSQTLLHNDATGNYEFAHKSLAEFFVALKLGAELGGLSEEYLNTYMESDNRPALLPYQSKDIAELDETFGYIAFSNEMMKAVVHFLCYMIGDRCCNKLMFCIKTPCTSSSYRGGNAATILSRKNRTYFRNVDLTGVDISYADLSCCDLQETILKDSNMISVDLNGAIFDNNIYNANIHLFRANIYFIYKSYRIKDITLYIENEFKNIFKNKWREGLLNRCMHLDTKMGFGVFQFNFENIKNLEAIKNIFHKHSLIVKHCFFSHEIKEFLSYLEKNNDLENFNIFLKQRLGITLKL